MQLTICDTWLSLLWSVTQNSPSDTSKAILLVLDNATLSKPPYLCCFLYKASNLCPFYNFMLFLLSFFSHPWIGTIFVHSFLILIIFETCGPTNWFFTSCLSLRWFGAFTARLGEYRKHWHSNTHFYVDMKLTSFSKTCTNVTQPQHLTAMLQAIW